MVISNATEYFESQRAYEELERLEKERPCLRITDPRHDEDACHEFEDPETCEYAGQCSCRCEMCEEGNHEQAYYNELAIQGEACPICTQLFGGDFDGLQRHLKTEHTEKAREKLPPYCPQCERPILKVIQESYDEIHWKFDGDGYHQTRNDEADFTAEGVVICGNETNGAMCGGKVYDETEGLLEY